ncbi:uncharacterized protein LOC120932394 [Rana temporaria]|uniref:uncharacterized protein LOC120932394 n=1 Tax=Rana temporaria TaxID=8407 RepID=UPI001AAD4F6C|nr:uncharacterized protein LOC120932394 [Rana temporaria]
MKIAVCLLLVAISCCFNPAASNCERRCASVCRQSQLTDVTCLQNAMFKNMPATVNAMTNVLCAYDKAKVSENKVVVVIAIRNLQEITGCNLANLLGAGTTLEALSLDVTGYLQNLLRGIHDILMTLNLGDGIIPQCGSVKSLLTKTGSILSLYFVPSFIGQSQATRPIDRVTRLLALLQIRNPKLLQLVLEVLLGPGVLVRELIVSLSGLPGVVIKNVGDLGKKLDGTTAMVTDVTGSLLQSSGGTAGSVTRSNGLLSGVTQLVPTVLQVVNSAVHTIGDTLEKVTNSVEGLLGGPDSGLINTATGLIGNLDSNTGILGTVGSVLGEPKSGPLGIVTEIAPNLLDGVLGANGPLGSVANIVPELLGGVLGTSGSGSNSGPTRIIPNPTWGSDSTAIQASGEVTGGLDGNVAMSAGANLDLGRPISNTGYPGGSMIGTGGVNDLGGLFSESGVARAADTSAYRMTSLRLK